MQGPGSNGGRDDVDSDGEQRPPLLEGRGGEQERNVDEEDNDVRPPVSKRRKTVKLARDKLHNTTRTQRPQGRGRRSIRQQIVQASARGGGLSLSHGIPSPPSSQVSQDEEASGAFAKFEEWPLENVSLKRVTVNGVTTFQLQFTWDSCSKHGHGREDLAIENQGLVSPSRRHASAKRGRATRATFATSADELLIELKEKLGLPCKEIHKRFTESFPGRSVGALQVRYCTKLKGRGSSKTGSQRERSSQARG
ncbi:hypothetical protein QBC46DRAFT_68952 [Diplogelasinospora grovesii]|uniref:Uncharacterized protein n=1 Tax=Diplogelasinospora grovesii TaxID=303347 RepID=A0AAN6NF67_9PEZI|nr:hypothetical protein QBC46DRAFT_68952 [Diplogelasinospora grovesii]